MNNKKYTPRFDYDYITNIYLKQYIADIFRVGSIIIGADPTNKINGKWEKITNVTIGSKNVDAWLRIE